MKSLKLLRIISLTLIGATVIGAGTVAANAAWKQNSTGWWYTEGSSWATGWRYINGAWYYFDSNGYMKTGWVQDRGTWYFLDASGAMKTGWVLDRGTWYFLESSGAMKTGWALDRGTWYFLDSSGAMKTGWVLDKGTWYFLKSSGAMAANEIIEYKNNKYSLESSGAMTTGWKNINNDTYYFNTNGDAAKGLTKIGDSYYYFNEENCKIMRNYIAGDMTTDENGKVVNWNIGVSGVTGFKKIDGKTYYYKDDKKVTGFEVIRDSKGTLRNYYFDKDGVMQTGWLTIEGKKYYADSYGVLEEGASRVDEKLYYFNSSSELVTTPGLYTFTNKYYSYKLYVKEDGTLATGWKSVDGKKYYFNNEGVSVEGLVDISGKKYYFNNAYELQCNINHYGLSTNEKGEVTKFNDASIKEDILKNDSKAIKELKDKYGEISINYKSFGDLNYLIECTDIKYIDGNKEKTFDENQDAFLFEAKANVNGKSVVVKKYYVSSLEGNIYIREDGDREGDAVLSEDKLSQIKDNKITKLCTLSSIDM